MLYDNRSTITLQFSWQFQSFTLSYKYMKYEKSINRVLHSIYICKNERLKIMGKLKQQVCIIYYHKLNTAN